MGYAVASLGLNNDNAGVFGLNGKNAQVFFDQQAVFDFSEAIVQVVGNSHETLAADPFFNFIFEGYSVYQTLEISPVTLSQFLSYADSAISGFQVEGLSVMDIRFELAPNGDGNGNPVLAATYNSDTIYGMV